MSNLIEKFIVTKSRKYPKNTLRAYESDVKLFINKVVHEKKISQIEAIKSITPMCVENFINDNEQLIREKKYSRASLNRKLSSLTCFYDFLIDMDIVEKNPFKSIDRYTNVNSKHKECLSIEEIKKIINETYIKMPFERKFEFSSVRTRLIISIMATTGMRIEEVLQLKLGYIIPIGENFIVQVPKSITKNEQPKRVPICGITKKYYLEYMNIRKKINADNDLLILSNNYKKLSTKDSRESIKKYVNRIGIEKNIGNHSFRHTFRNVLTEKNTNESLLCCIGGWSRKRLGNQSDVYLHDDERLDNIKIEICKDIL